jgi:uncharacterized membrane protein
MKTGIPLLIGLGLGAGLMYVLDPQGGNRRRALLRDKLARGLRKSKEGAGVAARDARNRAVGIAAETRARLTGAPVEDAVLAERVRAELGRVCSHPRSIEVAVRESRVVLSGEILAEEYDRVLSWVRSVPGVSAIESQLEVHERPSRNPALQGGAPRRVRSALMQTNWSPATRGCAGAGGAALALFGVSQRGLLGLSTGLAGLGLLARGLTNLELSRLVGIGPGRPAIDIRKTLNIQAPVERVFEFWQDFRRFPEFMSNVREVQDLGDGRSYWTIAGPAGVPAKWEAVLTDRVVNARLAWRTVPGSSVEHVGRVRFRPNRSGGTRLDINLSYAPPAGTLGHGIAALFGADPKREMDADLARMKTLIETGRPPRDAAQPVR